MFNIITIDGDNRLRLGDKQIAITDKSAWCYLVHF